MSNIHQRNQPQVNIRAPDAFDFAKPETWPAWEKRFLRYISLANLSWMTHLQKIDLLCYTMGEQSEEILPQIIPDNDAYFHEVLKAFREHFISKKNIILERSRFNARVQLAGERVDTFITALHSLAERCDYATLKDELIRDRIVVGIRDSKTSERLKLMSDLTLFSAIKEVRQAERRAKGNERSQLE